MSYCQRAVSVRQSTSDIGMTKGTWVATDARMACGCWCSENGQVVGFRLCPANAIVHLLQPGRLSGSWLTGQLFFFSYVAVVAVRGLRVLCLALLSLIDVHAFHLLSLSSNWSLTLAFGRLSDEAMAYSYIFLFFHLNCVLVECAGQQIQMMVDGKWWRFCMRRRDAMRYNFYDEWMAN